MSEYLQVTGAYVLGMAEVLGMSPEAVSANCTIRELQLYAATIDKIAQAADTPAETEKSVEEQIANWEAELGQ